MKKVKKDENMNPKNENTIIVCKPNATTIYFLHNNDCVKLVIHAIIHGNQTI